MAEFSASAHRRIRDTVHTVEGRARNRGPRFAPPGTLPDGDEWYELAGNLDAGGQADCHPLRFDASTDTYTAVGAITVKCKDLSGGHWGLEGERIRCRPVYTAADGWCVEPVSSGAPSHWVTLDAALSAGSSAAATATVRGESVSLTVYDRLLDAGQSVGSGAGVVVHYDVDAAKWYALATPCDGIE